MAYNLDVSPPRQLFRTSPTTFYSECVCSPSLFISLLMERIKTYRGWVALKKSPTRLRCTIISIIRAIICLLIAYNLI